MKTMRYGINKWKAAELLPYLHDKSQIQSEGSPELVLEIKLTVGWDFRDIALCCFCSPGGDLLGTRWSDTCFQKFMLALQLIYSTFCHQEAHLTAI